MIHFLTDSRARTRRTRRARRPAVSQLENVEALENRLCPTALFSASVTAGVLNVAEMATGSGSQVTISENAAHNRITVTGSGSTSINTGSSASFDLSLTTINSINVTYSSSNNANDRLTVQDVSLPNSLTVTLAAKTPTSATTGNNTVNILRDHFNSVVVSDPVTSTAHDHVTLDHDTIGGSTTVTEGNGVGDSTRVTNSFTGNTGLFQGTGLNDEIEVDNVHAGNLNTFNNSLPGEGDFTSIENVVGDSLFANSGAGNNFFEIENVVSDFEGTVNGGVGGTNVIDTDGSVVNVAFFDFAAFVNQPDGDEA
jgi:hypothetical protein